MTTIDWNLPVETTEDPPRPVRVLCTDAGEQYPIVALISREPILFTKDGHEWPDGCGITLRNVPSPKPEPVLREAWVNLYCDNAGPPRATEGEANDVADPDRVECRRIAWMSDGSPVPGEDTIPRKDYEAMWAKAEALQAEVERLKPTAMTDHENMLSTPEELLAKPCDQWCELEILSAYRAIKELVADYKGQGEVLIREVNAKLEAQMRAEKAESDCNDLSVMVEREAAHRALAEADLAAARAFIREVTGLRSSSWKKAEEEYPEHAAAIEAARRNDHGQE